ncbi:hypothetical protein TNCV_3516811 [Trichonephila clavipes]|nr:hypothetical protein TNCV_3516811 [Trichonephila clavipes]
MILAYGATDCNGRAAQGCTPKGLLSGGLLLIPCLLAYTSNYVRPVHSRRQRNRDRTARTELNEEIVLDMVDTTPSLSTRGIANEIGISYGSVWRILDDSALHPFHYQRV